METLNHKALIWEPNFNTYCLGSVDASHTYYEDVLIAAFVRHVRKDIQGYNKHITDLLKSLNQPKGGLGITIFGDDRNYFSIHRDRVNRFTLVFKDSYFEETVWRLGSKAELFNEEILDTILADREINLFELLASTKALLTARNFSEGFDQLKRPKWYKRLKGDVITHELEGASCGGLFKVVVRQVHPLLDDTQNVIEVHMKHDVFTASTDLIKGGNARYTSSPILGELTEEILNQTIARIQAPMLVGTPFLSGLAADFYYD
ncbi:hypothetical protein D6_0012 [Aeromonas phage D6]|uniref:Uncharacterized protein n=1 Tax=Aeromonas phage D6 TaxID=2593322 RepID=A0A514TVW8_9CAUD|nr:hypothetical protein PQC08_gp263 [Aeromonas phage D6]QDJ97171.1 hypothetical protein D6_0012 [Aeromonas phage D6]